jgi:glutaredoxin
MAHPPVKMYTLSTCHHCRATKKFLNECKIAYEFTDVDLITGPEREAILAEVRRFNPACSFPTIIIGDTVIVGHDEPAIKKALGLA